MLALAIDSMTMAKARGWQMQYGLTHFVGWDSTDAVYQMYGDGYIPFNVIIGQNMTVLLSDSDAGISGFQSVIEAELNKPPTTPSGLAVSNQGPISIGLQWNANTERDVAGYQMTCNEVGLADRAVIDVGLTTNYTVAELDLYSTYQFTLKAYDYRGHYSPATAAVTGSTAGDVPALSVGGMILMFLLLTHAITGKGLRISRQSSN